MGVSEHRGPLLRLRALRYPQAGSYKHVLYNHIHLHNGGARGSAPELEDVIVGPGRVSCNLISSYIAAETVKLCQKNVVDFFEVALEPTSSDILSIVELRNSIDDIPHHVE